MATAQPTRACPLCSGREATKVFTCTTGTIIDSNPFYHPARRAKFRAIAGAETQWHIVRCNRCAFTYSNAVPPDAILSLVYGELSETPAAQEKALSITAMSENVTRWHKLLELLRPGTGRLRVLDIGCGWGAMLMLTAGPKTDAVGVEPNPIKAGFSSDWGTKVYPDLSGAAVHAPFDVLICEQVLEHLDNPSATLRDAAALLAPNACGIVSVPNFTGFNWRNACEDAKRGSLGKTVNPIEHLNYFDRGHLIGLLSNTGFEVLGGKVIPFIGDQLNTVLRRITRRSLGTEVYVRRTSNPPCPTLKRPIS